MIRVWLCASRPLERGRVGNPGAHLHDHGDLCSCFAKPTPPKYQQSAALSMSQVGKHSPPPSIPFAMTTRHTETKPSTNLHALAQLEGWALHHPSWEATRGQSLFKRKNGKASLLTAASTPDPDQAGPASLSPRLRGPAGLVRGWRRKLLLEEA